MDTLVTTLTIYLTIQSPNNYLLNNSLQFRKMIEKHNPWGRKGGGAPNDTIRMTNILEKGLFPETFNDIRNYMAPVPLPKCRGGGGGAPLRSDNGQIITVFRDDPQLSFNNPTKNVVDQELRYRTTQKMQNNYKMELGGPGL